MARSPFASGPVDRTFAKMIAYKRLITGTLAIVAGIVMIVVGFRHGGSPPPAAFLALVIFFGGGGWALHDGLRLRRELRR